jgi:hypothetical protein
MDAMLPPRHDRNYRYQRQCADGGRGRFNAVILLAYLQLGESWRRPLLVAYGLAPEVAELLVAEHRALRTVFVFQVDNHASVRASKSGTAKAAADHLIVAKVLRRGHTLRRREAEHEGLVSS